MDVLFEAYVTNLGKYNEGELVGEYLKFPTTTEEVQALFKRIGVDGVRYEEFFLTDFESDIDDLTDYMGAYENIDELNHLACLISELDEGDLEKFKAVLFSGEFSGGVKDLINLAQNLDCYELYPGIDSEEELGRMYLQEFEAIQIPEHLVDYIDYEAYGRDARINEGGSFCPGGYVINNNDSFVEHYSGLDDIPDEHRVFSLPKLSIREQMAAYQEVSEKAAAQRGKPVPEPGREDR